MSRWLVLLFTLLLPVQLAWSAAAAFCQHEVGGAAQSHVGHHAHVHVAAEGVEAGSGQPQGAAHADCKVCSAATTPLIPQLANPQPAFTALSRPHGPEPAPLTSVLSRAPDRPQWLRLV